MSVNFCLTLCQLNPTVGDIAGNAAKAVAAHQRGKQKNADFVALPEMFLTGYQTQDLVTKRAFLDSVASELAKLAKDCADGPALGIGAPVLEDGELYNGYFVLKDGKIHRLTRKHHLPNTHVSTKSGCLNPALCPARSASDLSASVPRFARMRGTRTSAKPWPKAVPIC